MIKSVYNIIADGKCFKIRWYQNSMFMVNSSCLCTTLIMVGLSDPAPTSAPSTKSRSGISWMGWNCPPGVSLLGQYFFFLLVLFFPARFFLSGDNFLITFFFSLTPDPKIFLGISYLPTTYLLPFFLPTHLPPPSYKPLPTHLLLDSPTSPELGIAWVAQSVERRLGTWRHKARGASTWWQKWELEGELPSLPSFLFCVCVFFLLWKRWW